MVQAVTLTRLSSLAALAGLSLLLAANPASAAHRRPGGGGHGHPHGGFHGHGHPHPFHGHPHRGGGGVRFGHPHGARPHGFHERFGFHGGTYREGGHPYPAYFGGRRHWHGYDQGYGYRHGGYGYGGYGGGFAVYGRPAPYGIHLGCSVSRHVSITPWGWHKIVTTKVCYVP